MASKRKRKTKAPPRQPSRLPAALSIFEAAGIKVERGADERDHWAVGDKYLFWPMAALWRSFDGKHTGSGAQALVTLIKDGAPRPPPECKTLRERRADAERAMNVGLSAVAAALDPAPYNDCQGELPHA